MQTIPDDNLLERLKNEDDASFETLYQFCFPSVSSYVIKNSGNADDARDIFQEAIIILLQKIRQPDFLLTSSLKTYLFAIAKNLWLKRLRDNKLVTVDEIEKYQREPVVFSVETEVEKTVEEKLDSWFAKITKFCQRILRAIFFDNETMDSLMKKMGWKNKHTAANQKYKCIQQLKKQKDREV